MIALKELRALAEMIRRNPALAVVHAGTLADGLLHCLEELGRRVAALEGKTDDRKP